MIDKLKAYFVQQFLKRVFSWEHLMQPSTWRGIVYGVAGFMGYEMSGLVQDQITASIISVISAAFMINGTINTLRNENKQKGQ